MEEYITNECIVEEYLNNWFTYSELAEYLCIPLSRVHEVLEEILEREDKLAEKIQTHAYYIQRYYEELDKKPYILGDEQIYVDIALYMIENHSSIRKTAAEFNLGKSTVYDYIHEKLPRVSIVLYKQVFDVLTDNKSYSTSNKKVIEQVLTSYDLLAQGKSSEEIATTLNVGRNVIQRNLTNRLRLIDQNKYFMAQEILTENQLEPLREYGFKPNVR